MCYSTNYNIWSPVWITSWHVVWFQACFGWVAWVTVDVASAHVTSFRPSDWNDFFWSVLFMQTQNNIDSTTHVEENKGKHRHKPQLLMASVATSPVIHGRSKSGRWGLGYSMVKMKEMVLLWCGVYMRLLVFTPSSQIQRAQPCGALCSEIWLLSKGAVEMICDRKELHSLFFLCSQNV